MGILSIFGSKKEFFSAEEKQRIVEAIRLAERATSGEIRVFVESKNPYVDPLERAAEVFYKLKMEHTQNRNAVLLYIAMVHHELALFGDEGIYKAVGKDFWEHEVRHMITDFRGEHVVDGIVDCVGHIGQALKEKFPYESSTDKNELPDEIVFGH